MREDKQFEESLNKFGIDLELPNIFGNEDIRCFEFIKTPTLSTYLYAIMAGPYDAIESQLGNEFRIPMKIYCRKSLTKYV